MNIPEST